MLTAIAVDTHTHTVLSGHAWSTLRENAVVAARVGLRGMVLTEHAVALPGAGPFFLPAAQGMLPKTVEGVRVYRGVEANIVDMAGTLDTSDDILRRLEFCLASLHDLVVKPGTVAQNTDSLVAALNNPRVDVLCHIDDRRAPSDFPTVAGEAARLGKLIEINNNSISIRKGSRERVADLAGVCARLGARVVVASDAHFDEMIGNVAPALELLAGIGFPDGLVVNRSFETFESYLAERAERLGRV